MAIATTSLKGAVGLQPSWTFEKTIPMGGSTGQAFTNTLAAPGLLPGHVLGREAIQNSADATRDDVEKPSIVFRSSSLSGDAKSAFVATSRLAQLSARGPSLQVQEPNCLSELSNPDAPLKLLYIEDYGTTGLSGEPQDDESKFFRLLLALGDGSKEDEHGSGGSFGYGKSVYLTNSRIYTIFAYSRTENGDGLPHSVLLGCSFFKKHKHDGASFTGRAWLGIEQETSPEAYQRVAPLYNEEADELAETLGFQLRVDDDFGTSILVVDADVDEEQIVQGIEDWWWPRIVSNLLDVEVIDANGQKTIPRPKKREDLKPFLDAFEIAKGMTPAKSGESARRVFNRKNELGMGTCAVRVVPKLSDDDYAIPEERRDAVALIREPRMVVGYFRQGGVGRPVVAGVYIADEDIDDILKLSEPAAHDKWDPNASRLRDATGFRRDIVDTVLNRIKKEVRGFQAGAAPPAAPKVRRLTIIEKTLAALLRPTKRGGGERPEPSSAPIQLQYSVDPTAVATAGDQLKLKTKFSIRPKPEQDEPIKVRLHVSCFTVVDGAQEGDPVAVVLKIQGVTFEQDGEDYLLELEPGGAVHVTAESEAYDPTWTVRFVPEVEAVQ